MNEIKVAENKTLKLTNVVARRIAPEAGCIRHWWDINRRLHGRACLSDG